MQAVDGRNGGTLIGDAHRAPSGGIHTLNVDTNQTLLVEGKEAVINKAAVNKPGVQTYTGTNKEILSKINQSAGNGVPILENGGVLPPPENPVSAEVPQQLNYPQPIQQPEIQQPIITEQSDYPESVWGNPLLDYIFASN